MSIGSLKKEVIRVFKNNRRVGSWNGWDYDFTCPSPGVYPHQWLWDSCFNAIVLSYFDIERAKKEIETLLLPQKENGFISCVTLWKKRFPLEEIFYTTGITQSPVIPISVETVYRKSEDTDFVKRVYPKLKLYFDWLYRTRDRNSNGLLEILHPWESGTDSIPSFDKELGFKSHNPSTIEVWRALLRILFKYQSLGWDENKMYRSEMFLIENITFNSIYAKSLVSMKYLASVLGKKNDESDWTKRYEKVRNSLIKLSWSRKDGLFYDLDRNGKQIRQKSTSCPMPLILPDLPHDVIKTLVEKHLLDRDEFWSPYPVASVPINEKTFNSKERYVLSRGPVWINVNWFLSKALKEKGYRKEAKVIIKKTVELVERNGFREYFNPFTGAGNGQKNFTWGGLILDMLGSAQTWK